MLETTFKINHINPNITHLEFDSGFAMCAAMMRFQAFYEDPTFRGKIFSRPEFEDWYRALDPKWLYHEKWAGFNITDQVFAPFLNSSFDPLTDTEAKVVNLFRETSGAHSVIATSRFGCPLVLKHEICHALYYTDVTYRASVDQVLADYDSELGLVKEEVARMGYSPVVLMDEVHANLIVDERHIKMNKVDHPVDAKLKLKAIFDSHYSNLARAA